MPQFEKNLGPKFHWVPPVHLSEALKNPQVWMRLLVLAGMMQIRYELFKKHHRSPAATGSLGAWKWRVLEVLGKVRYGIFQQAVFDETGGYHQK